MPRPNRVHLTASFTQENACIFSDRVEKRVPRTDAPQIAQTEGIEIQIEVGSQSANLVRTYPDVPFGAPATLTALGTLEAQTVGIPILRVALPHLSHVPH